jgi:hypothetical protein
VDNGIRENVIDTSTIEMETYRLSPCKTIFIAKGRMVLVKVFIVKLDANHRLKITVLSPRHARACCPSFPKQEQCWGLMQLHIRII